MIKIRVGQGFDAHRWQVGKPLVLGGVTIPHYAGLEAHSDGDVLIHAVCDALLGATGLCDIGYYFPNTEANWKNVDSRILLRRVVQLIEEKNCNINNIDATLLAEAPKLTPYRQAMSENLAVDLKIETSQITIKATTTEGMGFIGRKEGIAALVVVLVTSD